MNDFERGIREAMTAHELENPDVDGLVAGLRRPDGPSRARWPIVLAAAACVLLVAGGAVVGASLWHDGGHGQRSVAQSNARTGAPAVVPAGWKPVSFHGLQVYVPADFGYDQTNCGNALADTVNVDFIGQANLCGRLASAASSVNFVTTQSPNRQYVPTPATPTATILDGHAAITGVATVGARTQGTVQIADLGVEMGVDSASAATVAAIVKSASVVSTDANGCPSVRPGTLDSNATRSVVSMVPNPPTSARLCRYDDTGLIASARLMAFDAASLAMAMNERPAVSRSQISCATDSGEAVQATFTAADGAQTNIQVIISGVSCPAGLSNGLLTRASGPAVAKLIVSLVGSAQR